MTDVASPAPAATADWVLCGGCRHLVYGKRLRRNLHVCPECDRHEPIGADERLRQLLDPGSVAPLDLPAVTADPLGFVDTVPYPQRVERARRATGVDEAVRCARGTVHGRPLVVAVMDFRFLGGSLGCAVGELITLAAETALADRTPLLIVAASGGARMQEGALSLMQMAKTAQALAALDEAGVLTVSLVTDPTFGGTAASFATLTDVIMAEPGARLGFAGPRVIEQTIRRPLPAGFQTAEFLLERGLIDLIRPRRELRATLADLLATVDAPAPAPVDADVLLRDPEQLPQRDAWQAVREARALERPTTLEYAARLLHGFVELRGDRAGADCPAIVGGVGRLDGRPVLLVGHRKGHTPAEMLAVNHGMASPAGYRKAQRLMRLAAKLGLPVVTLVDTPGAYPGLEAEEQGQAIAVAESIRLMSGLPVPVVSVVTGEGGSGGALALAVADRVYLCANAVYSVISPEGCAAILWKDATRAPTAARALRLEARELLRLGVVDAVVPEPAGGAGADPPAAAEQLRRALTRALHELSGLSPRQLVAERRARFRRFGTPETLAATAVDAPAPLIAPLAAGKGEQR
ncbi:acetyl-CoA carboxylase, carboxyltransferase subunit beta [Micromonospora auratinigra]|uniref:Multifunctional fusion protein n=1 Tax=Micromonospora auratinigra TaxID=261654 RepID=A0A1A8ZFS0_9ACTN|nr:acetyl-CoA carboxylase, carboxyltransferase subunit beta [Micromonospora auratinigra]SBT42856.1 acetyl-CoA carboxylase carboxyltransferase subunit alpha [Micromonospora auratinigra]